MAQLVLSVTWRHCNQLDTIEGGKEGGWQQQQTQFATSRPHLYQYNCKSKYFLFTNNSLGIALLQNYSTLTSHANPRNLVGKTSLTIV